MPNKKRLWLALTWTIVITILSLVSFSNAPDTVKEIEINDKAVHFVFYSVFVLLWGSYVFTEKQIQNKAFLRIIILALLLGGVIEILQEYCTTTRTADWYDMLANTLGAITGMVIFYGYRKIKQQE